jgi:hypothetical protein
MRRWILGLIVSLFALAALPAGQIANEVWSNNGTSTLASAIDGDDTSLTVATGDGALFPSPTGSQFMWLTLQEGSTYEIVKCTARSSDVISGCTRAQQGTSAHAFTTAATVDNALTAGSTVTGVFHAEDYGVACDGSTDDTSALQSAIDATKAIGGTLILPTGVCVVSDTLVVGGGDGSGGDGSSFVSLVGQGQLNTVLQWNGSSSGTLLSFQQNKYFIAQGFSVRNQGGRGTTVGVVLTGPGTTGGTSTLMGQFRMVMISGFQHCMEAGGGDASSEILYTHVGFEDCGTGWQNYGLNTLDHVFEMATCSASDLCFEIDAGNAYIDGGSLSNNTQDIDISGGGFAAADAVAIRNVRSENAGLFVAGGIGEITIENCMVAGLDGDDAIHITSASGIWRIVGNQMDGRINFTDGGQAEIRGNRLQGDETLNLPFVVTGGQNQIVNASTNWVYDATGPIVFFQDVRGMYDANGLHALQKDDWTISTIDRSFPHFVHQDHHVNAVSLGERSTADGHNLRVGVKFNSDDTATVSFARSMTITQDASTNTKFATDGYFTAADVGKLLTYTDGTNNFQQIITGFDGTSETVAANLGLGAGQTSSATIGEDEPDAHYLIAGYACDAPEALGFTSLATTGFTVTSSNSSSTATCTILIVR